MVGDPNNRHNFLKDFLLTNTEISRIRKALGNGSSGNIKFSKTELSKIIQLGGFLNPFDLLGFVSNPEKALLDGAKKKQNLIRKV